MKTQVRQFMKSIYVLVFTLCMWAFLAGCGPGNPTQAIDPEAPSFADPIPSPTQTSSLPEPDDPIADCALEQPTCVIQLPINDSIQGLRVELSAIQTSSNKIRLSVVLMNNTPSDFRNLSVRIDGLPEAESTIVLTGEATASWSEKRESVTWLVESVTGFNSVGPLVVEANEINPRKPPFATIQADTGQVILAQTHFGAPEDASQSRSSLEINAFDVEIYSNMVVHYASNGTAQQTLPLGSGSDTAENSPFKPIQGTGIRYFNPGGDLGLVEIKRQPAVLPAGVDDDQIAIAAVEITKEHAGSAIFIVPLEQPAPPYSMIRVFVDHGEGYYEQSVLGTVTSDGLRGTFAADGSSSYLLTTTTSNLDNLSSASLGSKNSGLFGDIHADLAEIEGSLEALERMAGDLQSHLFNFTDVNDSAGHHVWVSQQSLLFSDLDGDGLSYIVEMAAGTNPDLRDSDGDGAYDGEEIDAGTDPNDASSFPDIGPDGIYSGEGCRTWICFAPSEGLGSPGGGESNPSGSGGNPPGASTGSENIPGLAPSLEAAFEGIENAVFNALNISPPDDQTSANMSTLGCDPEDDPGCTGAGSLRAAIALVDAGFLIMMPPGQAITPIFSSPSKLLAMSQADLPNLETLKISKCSSIAGADSNSHGDLVITLNCQALSPGIYRTIINEAMGVCVYERNSGDQLECIGPWPVARPPLKIAVYDPSSELIYSGMLDTSDLPSPRIARTPIGPKPSPTTQTQKPTATPAPPKPTATTKPADPTAKPTEGGGK